MARASIARRRELLDLWRGIQEEEDAEGGDPSSPKHRSFIRAKEDWFSDCFKFLVGLPNEDHIWCGYADMMGPLLETFHGYFMVKEENSPLRTIWKRISKELDICTQCVCQHHQAQEFYDVEYQSDTVDPLLKVLRFLDEERVTEHLKQINARIQLKEYSPSCHSAAVVSVMFEVLMYPVLLDDQLLADQFQIFIEAIDESYEVSLSINQQYPGVYALLFFKSGRARAIGLRLARSMGKLRRAADLEPLQPLLTKYINFLEADVLPSSLESSRPRVQLRRADVWLGFKSLLGFLEAPAFEDGILERYPIFLNIVLNHVSDDTSDLSCAVSCLKASFEMLGCKLWLRTTLSPSVMRNTLLGHCFHTRDEKSHKEIFDLFLPFLQSLEALQDGEHEKQRRNILFFLLHQVTRSSNFSVLMRKNACKIALLIVQRGYIMSPPCPPSECAHMWGPTLISSLKDTSLHSSLRQPAFDLMNILVISDASALISFKLKYQSVAKIDVSNSVVFVDDEDELPFSHDAEEKDYSCWNDFCVLSKMTSRECKDWSCVPLLWYLTMVQLDPSMLPIAFSKAVFWALSHVSVLEPGFAVESSVPVDDWLSSNAREISSSFSWQIPNGSDDGGDGKESRNTLNVSTFCTLLLRIFKRFATNFIMQIEHRELQKQWIWEPMMAESLILSLIDHNDNLRQFGRAILEHVSQARGLTSGLQFLCSSASSLSAVFLGLRYAVRLVEAKSVLGDFHSLHHLFFVMCKLLREVVAHKPPVAQPAKPSEGGFLRQTFLNLSISSPEHAATVVDVVSWEKFSTLLSATLWPFVLMCLEKGEELMNNKQCQIACVRLLELFPLVYERVNSYSCIQSCNMIPTVPNLSDLTWLSHLINWGRSSLLVIIRHWKQCMLSLFERLKGSHSGTFQQNIDALGDLISHDTVDIDELKERVLNLKLIWSKEAFAEMERGAIVKVPMVARPISSIPSLIGRTFHERHTSGDNVVDVETTKPSHAATSEKVIVLSDSEEESLTTVDLDTPEVLSSVVTEKYKPTNSDISREQAKSSQPGKVIEDSQASLKQQICTPVGDIGASSRPVSADSGSTTAPSKVAGQRKKLSASSNADTTSVRLRKAKSSATATCQPLRPNLSSNSEKFKSIFREISDDEDDPLEHALDNCRRSKPLLTKPSILVPKRQVVQLPLPAGNKQGFVSRTDVGLRRLRPPKLDSWYKDILGMDYFAVAGLSSPEITKKPALKEVPVHFDSEVQYVEIFRPLVLEEFKAQLQNACIETSPDDMICGSISILSVERVDDFLIIRGRPEDSEFVASRGCTENDLILLTKEPLKNSGQQVHVLGKVERREKTNKNKAFIFVIRFFLSKENARLNKVKRLLVERSKWFLNRVMSMTPQLREFSALSSLNDIPVLPIILNPIGCPASYHVSGKVRLDKLPQPMQKVLKSSYNDSQLQAVSVAIGSINSKRNFELSLIQGPPGTGKTRTIVAIVSALLSLYADNFCKSLRNECLSSAGCTNARTKMSQSAAIARAWQDAAFAKQMIKDSQIGSPKMTERLSKGRALICAQSNAAVDELVSRLSEGLYGADGKVYRPYIVRVGNAKTVHPNSLPCFIDTLVEQRLADELKTNTDAKSCCNAESSITLRARFEKVVDRIRHLESRRKLIEGPVPNEDETDEVSDEAIGAKLNILYAQKRAVGAELAAAYAREKKIADEKMSLKHKVRKSILGEAEIVVTTLSGCGGDIYGVCSESASANKFGNFSEHTLFDAVVIDEAAQALEPATLIPLQLLKSKGTKCIMVGDPKQLPATVMSGLASKFLYECSMFERLQRAGHPVIMLTEQYRMHPEISRFPSLHFYENKLLDGAQMSEKSAPFHDHHCLGPYKFFDVKDGREHCGKNGATQSLCNASEADAAIEILKFLWMRYPSEFSCKKIGIITPYRSQLSLLRSKFTSLFGPEIVSEMELNTVDGFQGREVDILVLSTVRASDSSDDRHAGDRRSIGFVADVRRVNVALTRAKFSLWIVGNARTLQTNAHWASLIQNAKERNLFLSVERPYGLILGKVRSHSKDVLGVTRNNYIASLKQKEDDKIAAPSMILQRSDADVQKEQLVHTGRTVGKEASIHLLNHPSIGPKASQDLTKCSNQAKRASRWDQKDPKGQGSMVRRYSGDKKAVKQNNNVRMSKALLERDDHQDSMVRNHSEEKVPIKRDNNLEPTNRSVKSDSHQDSSVSSKSEVKSPVKQNDDVKTVKGLLKQDAVLESVPEKNDACPPKYPDMKKLIKKAKGARKFSERPTSGNSVDPSLSFQAGDASCHMSELNKSKATNLAGQNHLIAARKRQREDVEFLLSSALISSKKPSSNLPSKKQK